MVLLVAREEPVRTAAARGLLAAVVFGPVGKWFSVRSGGTNKSSIRRVVCRWWFVGRSGGDYKNSSSPRAVGVLIGGGFWAGR